MGIAVRGCSSKGGIRQVMHAEIHTQKTVKGEGKKDRQQKLE